MAIRLLPLFATLVAGFFSAFHEEVQKAVLGFVAGHPTAAAMAATVAGIVLHFLPPPNSLPPEAK